MTIKEKKIPTIRELREFGLIFGVFFVLVFALIIPWYFDKDFKVWPWWIFVGCWSLAFIYPLGLHGFFKAWVFFGAIMGWINTRIILGIVFYLILVPVGLVMKLLGKDLLSRKLDSKRVTYRVKKKSHLKDNMENPF